MSDDVFEALHELRKLRTPCVLATVVRTKGSTPRKSGARMLVHGDSKIVGTIGGGRVEKEIVDAALAMLARGASSSTQLLKYQLTQELAMCCGGEMEVFLEPMLPESPLVICGGGHVARALCAIARTIGFAPWVVEEAEEMATKDRFPEAAGFIDSFDVRDWKDVTLDAGTYVVVVTRDHAQDQALLEQIGERELAYLGLIGSKRKVEMFRQRLEAKGLSRAWFEKIHAPIGFDIGAETPEEIAVAIAAELIAERARKR